MTNLITLVGLPGSGKSNWAKIYKSTQGNVEIVSSDSLRGELYGAEETQGNNTDLFNKIHQTIVDHLTGGKDVIFDATNLVTKHRIQFLKFINAHTRGVHKKAVVFCTTYATCLERNGIRSRSVPENVVKRMRESFTCPQYYEFWDEIELLYDDLFLAFEMGEYDGKKILPPMFGFNQDNHHHTETLYNHTVDVLLAVQDECFEIRNAALLHDYGKLFTKMFRDARGNPSDIAHYYGHENVGAYESLFFLKTGGALDKEIIYTAGIIQNHMRMNNATTEKSRLKLFNMVGEQMYNDLEVLHLADTKGK